MKKTLLVDVDYVICLPGFLAILNKFLGSNYVEEDFEEYFVEESVIPKEKLQDFYEYYITQDGYEDAVFLDGAKEALRKLQDEYDIYLCSACVMYGVERKSGKLFKDKYDYIMRELDFIDPEKIIFTNTKNLFVADAQIDDRLPNLQGNINTKLLFSAYHNKDITEEELKAQNVIRVNSWKEVLDILLNIK